MTCPTTRSWRSPDGATPAVGWAEDPGWREISRVLPLAPLTAAESAAYLVDTPLLPAQRERVLRLAAGNPLVLTLARELATHLVERLVEVAPPEHRQALRVCALARTTTEPLLREVLERGDPAELYAWLHAQPYVETGPHGLYPHNVVREVLVAEKKRGGSRRRPTRCDTPSGAARCGAAARGPRASAARRAVRFPVRAPRRGRTTTGTPSGRVTGPPRPADEDGLRELLAQHAGGPGGAATLPWLDEQPGGVDLYRSGQVVQGAWCDVRATPPRPTGCTAKPWSRGCPNVTCRVAAASVGAG